MGRPTAVVGGAQGGGGAADKPRATRTVGIDIGHEPALHGVLPGSFMAEVITVSDST